MFAKRLWFDIESRHRHGRNVLHRIIWPSIANEYRGSGEARNVEQANEFSSSLAEYKVQCVWNVRSTLCILANALQMNAQQWIYMNTSVFCLSICATVSSSLEFKIESAKRSDVRGIVMRRTIDHTACKNYACNRLTCTICTWLPYAVVHFSAEFIKLTPINFWCSWGFTRSISAQIACQNSLFIMQCDYVAPRHLFRLSLCR